MPIKMLEGSRAVAEAVALCQPRVVAAYPITPQTHIVHELAQMVADGELPAEFVNVESEHSAASVCLGASATGVRVFTSTSSQGLILMSEVIFNIAGMRLPVVITCVNRALSAPLNIWTDQQDSVAIRDSGAIQLYAENNQEAADFIFLAYRVAEDHRVLLPVMVCMDGYIISHSWDAVHIPLPEEVQAYLPPYRPRYRLDPDSPVSMGMYAEPDKYMETRLMLHQAMGKALGVIQEAAHEFERVFGRPCPGLMEEYRTEDAETVFIAMGSAVSTVKMVVDSLRERGERVGVLKLVSFRPFPAELIRRALKGVKSLVVLDKNISLGLGGALAAEVRSAFYRRQGAPRISGFIVGLGGRDVTEAALLTALEKSRKGEWDGEFLDIRPDLELEV